MSPRPYSLLHSLTQVTAQCGRKNEFAVGSPVFDFSAKSGRVIGMFGFLKTEIRTDVFRAEQSAQTARLADPAHVRTLRALVHESRQVSKLSAFSVAKKILCSKFRVRFSSFGRGRLAVPLELIGSFHLCSFSQTDDDPKTDWADSAEYTPVHLRAKKNSVSKTNEEMISIRSVSSKALCAGKSLSSLGRTTNSVSCCRSLRGSST